MPFSILLDILPTLLNTNYFSNKLDILPTLLDGSPKFCWISSQKLLDALFKSGENLLQYIYIDIYPILLYVHLAQFCWIYSTNLMYMYISTILVHCKPSPFGKQFCLANTAIFPSYITFQNNQKKIFYPKQM